VKDTVTGDETTLPAQGLFFAIGHTPASAFLQGQLTTDETGYVITKPDSTATNIGVFAAGDVQDKKFRQAITAAGSGCMAAIEAEHYLEALASGTHH
jgi:thioredoxin reductase (NADPH)